MRYAAFPVAGALAALGIWCGLHPEGFLFALGIHPIPPGTPWTYQMWSGVIPALTVLSLFGGLSAHVRRLNCHVDGCWLLGRYPVAGGHYTVCRRHHPDHHVRRGAVSAGHIHELHALHLLRQSRPRPWAPGSSSETRSS